LTETCAFVALVFLALSLSDDDLPSAGSTLVLMLMSASRNTRPVPGPVPVPVPVEDFIFKIWIGLDRNQSQWTVDAFQKWKLSFSEL
jgi:hypothetical protein